MLATILLVPFLIICIALILIVLLQAGKGGGLAGAFGGSGGQTFLGARGAADFLSKLTIYLAIGFMALSLILSLTYGGGRNPAGKEKVQETESSQTEEGAAAEPGAQPTQGSQPQPGSSPDTSGSGG